MSHRHRIKTVKATVLIDEREYTAQQMLINSRLSAGVFLAESSSQPGPRTTLPPLGKASRKRREQDLSISVALRTCWAASPPPDASFQMTRADAEAVLAYLKSLNPGQ
jgi:hypothetical protein